ncbi:NINE protein [uncultured Clostridium sp.]|uniref:NINE protein n=1 Tax=uncultured Clostridium sp. TaxID=59620 RepID=UPI0025D660D4|nr:NINE protein [uncultured Clostridium sp.]
MSNMKCPQCGAPIEGGSSQCKYCGQQIEVKRSAGSGNTNNYQQTQYNQNQQPVYSQPYYNGSQMNDGINPAWPIKSKVAAGLLGIFLGGLGIHKFYLGKIGLGIVYLIFCWTYIPSIIGFIEGIIYLCQNDHNFQVKNHVRLQ